MRIMCLWKKCCFINCHLIFWPLSYLKKKHCALWYFEYFPGITKSDGLARIITHCLFNLWQRKKVGSKFLELVELHIANTSLYWTWKCFQKIINESAVQHTVLEKKWLFSHLIWPTSSLSVNYWNISGHSVIWDDQLVQQSTILQWSQESGWTSKLAHFFHSCKI